MTDIQNKHLTDGEMFRVIMEDMRHIRERLDANDDAHQSIRKEVAKIREEMSGERVKVRGITAGISLVVAGIVTWLVTRLS
jgi:uncharacterized membrane protein YdfJ with MMPL/SSD domain